MKLFDKLKNKKKIVDNSPELKRGEFKKILLPLIEKHFPDFQYKYYKNQYYSFQKTRKVNDLTIYESFDIRRNVERK